MLEFFRSETIQRISETLDAELAKNIADKNNSVTNARLLELLGIPSEDGPIVTSLIKRELSAKFDVKKGRRGGYILKDSSKKELNAA